MVKEEPVDSAGVDISVTESGEESSTPPEGEAMIESAFQR